jgi:hypothetical protein
MYQMPPRQTRGEGIGSGRIVKITRLIVARSHEMAVMVRKPEKIAGRIPEPLTRKMDFHTINTWQAFD